jgi:hypothetical protein
VGKCSFNWKLYCLSIIDTKEVPIRSTEKKEPISSNHAVV